MTLIAFATYGNHAEFITDTSNYTRNVSKMGTCTKHLTLNHLDTAVFTQGDAWFGEQVKGGTLQAGEQVATFDELIESAPSWLRQVWADALTEGAYAASVAFFIGWSTSKKKFMAYGFSSHNDFEPFTVPRLFVHPSPMTFRPSDLELARFRDYVAGRDDADELIEVWSSRKPGAKPESIADWQWLAKEVRTQRALESFARVIVAGQVFHTRIERGSVQTKRIHTYDDSGDEFLQLVAFTQHPQGQLVECWCDSGERFIDCHLAPHLDKPCACLSGKVLRECCAVSTTELVGGPL